MIYPSNRDLPSDDALIASNSALAPVNYLYRDRHSLILEQGFELSRGETLIGDDVCIGDNCVILCRTVISPGCVVSAGFLVIRDLPEFRVCVCTPVLQIDELNEY